MAFRAQYLLIDFVKLAEQADKYDTKYIESTFWFDVAIPVFAILLIVTLVSIANLVLKLMLMKGEQELIKEGAEAV